MERPEWDRILPERMEEASQLGRLAEVGAVICGEGTDLQYTHAPVVAIRSARRLKDTTRLICSPLFTGVARHGGVWPTLSVHDIVLQRIDVPVPRKRAGSATAHEKGLARFYDTLYQSFLRRTLPFVRS
jgi:protein pelota